MLQIKKHLHNKILGKKYRPEVPRIKLFYINISTSTNHDKSFPMLYKYSTKKVMLLMYACCHCYSMLTVNRLHCGQ